MFFNGGMDREHMRKALAQNPNMLRTLLGLSFTLIFMLSYAVYANTIDTAYYTYTTDASVSEQSSDSGLAFDRVYDEAASTTTWSANVTIDRNNLTWVNVSAEDLAPGATLTVFDAAGLWTHSLLGIEDARDFSCADDCRLNETTTLEETDGVAVYKGLAVTEPGARSNGTVVAESQGEADDMAAAIVSNRHGSAVLRVTIVEPGNRSTTPALSIEMVNEALSNVQPFDVDVASEFVWALTAVFACFSIVLLPAFAIYAVSRRKERANEAKLAQAEALDDTSTTSTASEEVEENEAS
ncbi:MAG: hypothetical protein CMA08_03510 [Euryarchaeota archaeon]|nr:hypothetical protein [Euryarchaeota archaeon]OUX21918.1 MAG: hypothetical protein CBE12_03150 [Euryarchaeota archaeon TMED252]